MTTAHYRAARIARGLCPHCGRDWSGRYMACVLPSGHRGKCVGSHGGTLKRERVRIAS